MASSHTSDSTFVAVVAVVGLVGVVLIMLIGRNRRGRARWMREWDEAQAARERTRQRPQLWDTWVRDDRADVCDTKLEDTKWENILVSLYAICASFSCIDRNLPLALIVGDLFSSTKT